MSLISDERNSIMISAAQNGRTNQVLALIDEGADIHALEDKALRQAASAGQTDTVQALLSKGANIHASKDGALRAAVSAGKAETVRTLLAHGADAHACDFGSLRWAEHNGHTEAVQIVRLAIEASEPAGNRADAGKARSGTDSGVIGFKITPKTRLADLFKPCGNDPDSITTPLILGTVWNNMDAVRDQLATQNERLMTEHLRAPTPNGKRTYLQFAIRIGALDQVIAIAEDCGQPLTLADLITPDKSGRSALDEIAEKKQIGSIFKAELWAGRTQDMVELWKKMPTGSDKTALQSELSRVSVLSMRQKMKGVAPAP